MNLEKKKTSFGTEEVKVRTKLNTTNLEKNYIKTISIEAQVLNMLFIKLII